MAEKKRKEGVADSGWERNRYLALPYRNDINNLGDIQMRINCRENRKDHWGWRVFDRDTGKDLTPECIIAVDDSTGQIIRYEHKDGKILSQWPLVSEIRNIELVCMEWPE